jgi:uncharacterized SAM-binding protein YcdF (DUF218 family)
MIDILKALVLPSNICFLLIVAGVLLSLLARTRKAALLCLTSAGVLLMVFASGKTATLLMSPLEYAYPRVADHGAARAIVVLSAYAADDPLMPLSSRPNPSGLYRVVEAFHLWQQCRDCRVLMTGSSPTTEVMAQLLVSLGVPHSQVQVDNAAANTAASATNVRRLLGDTSFFLVTSAGHMSRAMAVFTKSGMQPLPAPTDYQLPKAVAHADWRLSAFHLQCSDLAIHEYIGLWWYRLRGHG